MAQKIRDVAVKTGEYTSNGQTKARWQNVGALMKGDDGNEFIILHRWFNPAGVPNPDNRDSVILSCFKQDNQNQGQNQGGQRNTQQGAGQAYQNAQNGTQQSQQQNYGAPNPGQFDDFSDEIPFN